MHARLSQWWNEISIRTKITGITVTLVTLGLVVAGLGTMTVLSTYLMGQVDTSLKNSATNFTSASFDQADSRSCTVNFAGLTSSYVAILDDEGDLICDTRSQLSSASDAPDLSGVGIAGAPLDEAFNRYNSTRDNEWRLFAHAANLRSTDAQGSVTTVPAVIVAGTNLAGTNATIGRFGGIFLGFGLSVVVLGAALTRLLVTSTFAPLRDVEATAARFADGDFTQRLDSTTPNTEVGRLNRSLNTMLNRIDSAFDDRAKTIDQMRRFVGDASHELRTPLVSLRGYAELYRMGALTKPEDVAQAMDRIEKEAIRMGVLVQDLLALARLDESKPLELGPVDLVQLAHDSALDTMASNPDRDIDVIVLEPVVGSAAAPTVGDETSVDGHSLEVTPPPAGASAAGTVFAGAAPGSTGPISFAGATLARLRSLRARAVRNGDTDTAAQLQDEVQKFEAPAIVHGEENKIRQVITNLMGNAMRFTEPDSPIELVVQSDPGRGVATVAIVDHGEGIPPQIREKIFQRFWRADSSRTRDTGGSGLGLAIVSGIVAAHGGWVDVDDTPGGGATFRVALPLMPADAALPAEPAATTA
ncbi:cell wall metabolism sensor histidine kinase WalK [Frigoribacterium sp. VKM Ac-2836]|uniref:sensor histidine kinase n=1 Tax=Frigoribacterium sp. VKM Ac-2836 TaxID=2739014 RepID=UPI001565E8BE|nr:HAMP domain-containing sensor histidine kinase [Frigoribacterium sp. VKM Ac-2836]NRD26899.1 HAMP domain-containing histidine kinase [Frigoribacterium sp. VKM Ac-2836]